MTTSTPSAASGTTRDPSRATAAVNKLSRTLVKSLSADKAKPAATGERRPTSTEPSVSKSQSAMNVKKHAKSTTDEKELARKETKTAKVSLRMLLCLNSGISEKTVLSSGTLFQTLDFKKFCHGNMIVLSTELSVVVDSRAC